MENKKIIRSDNHVCLNGWMINELDLSGSELIVYAVIWGFTQDGNQWCTASQAYIARWANISTRGLRKVLDKLEEKGLLIKETNTCKKGLECKYRAVRPDEEEQESDGNKVPIRSEQSSYPDGNKVPIRWEQSSDNNIEDNIEDNNYSYSYKETLFELIENNIGRTLNSIEIELVGTWEDNDLTRYIIKQCILNQKYNIKYIDRVITSTKLKGIKTVVDFEKESETFKQQKQTKVKKTETFSEKLKRLQEEARNEEKEKK